MTLITGDRVVVTGRGHLVKPGPGRQVDFSSQVLGGHLYVIPADATPLIAQGVLDRRLFDVTQLLAWKYGDADTPDIPVISQAIAGQAIAPQGAQRVRQLSGLGMSAARVPKANAAQTWKDLTGGSTRALAAGRTKLWLDGRRTYLLDESVKLIGAPQAWQQGMTGKGVTVAVLDGGYDPDHPDLKDAVAQERNFTKDPDIRDSKGHGTHVASIVAGRGEKYRGVAPEATLAIGKVGTAAGLIESDIIAGMEWASAEVKAKVVNMSFGAPDTPELDLVEQAVNTLSERYGTLFVAGAGNDGREQSMYSPASADAALAVGSVDKQRVMAPDSSAGPRVGDHAIKPEVTAPGVAITAAAIGGGYVSKSGTSMASPHVAGAAAILAQRHPDWTGAQLKAALIGSAAPAEGVPLYRQGAGLADLTRVLKQQVVAAQGNVWAAFPWNASGERVATKTITYANAGDTPVTLDLSAQGEALKLPADQVTVPAKGEASVTLTIDATGKAPGDYPGTVTAKAGDTVIRTLAGAYVEPESYDVTLTVIGKQGRPINPRDSQIYDAKTGKKYDLLFADGSATVRLPKGDWNLFAKIAETVDGKRIRTVAVSPFKVDGGGRRVTVDARQGKQVKVALDDPSAALQSGYTFELTHGAWNDSASTNGDANSELFVVPIRLPGLDSTLETVWLSKDISPSPYVYSIVDHRTGGIPDDPTYRAKQQDLAKVTTTYRALGATATGSAMVSLGSDNASASSLTALVENIPLPGTLIHYRTPGMTYQSGLEVGTSLIFDVGRLAKRGETREVWNAAVIGPSFLLPGGNRTGDKLTFSAAGLFADGQPGRSGFDTGATGTATLAKDGQVLATADLANCAVYEPEGCELRADLPAGSGSYTLTASMRRQATLSTEVSTAWTFPSATTAKEQPLPLTAVRYSPQGLDTSNRAKPGSVTSMPLWVERNPGAAKAEAKSIRLEMSTDDGKSWRSVPVTRTESGWTAGVPNPRTAGFVSLRAVVTDSAGNGVTQTITRAYAVG
ncbi:S8 family serine peptidase [Nonomuraea sp. NPDC049141]|uniref:S8 family peptidase n=1 Tax=Nonomuraea sp. NPDC049141 TaxID=3155500 RepID=UPI0033F5EAEF